MSVPARPSPDPVDVLVVGGGPAGLAAGVVLSRSRRSVLVVDAGQPRNATAAGAHNYLGREGVAPRELLADGRAELASYGGRVTDGEVVEVASVDGPPLGVRFRAVLADGRTVDARRLVVTTGLVDELPAIPGLATGWGRDVLHCPFCHGWEVRDRAIGVLSTTPMTSHQALLFRQLSADVTVLTHTGPAPTDEQREQLDAWDVRVVAGEVVEVLRSGDALTGVRLASGEVVPLQALVVAAPAVARSELLTRLGVTTAPFEVAGQVMGSYAVSEPTGATSVPGVFAAGNVTTLQAQVIGSAAAGVMTGAGVHGDLIAEETAWAVSVLRNPPETHYLQHAHGQDEVPTDPVEAEAYWDARYAESEHNNGLPNPVLVQVAQALTPGTALDLGSGYGDDVVWLATQGWTVTGVDVSGAAVTRATAAAKAAGVADRAAFARHDLGRDFPSGEFDLVTTHYLHSPGDLPRDAVLRRAAEVVAPGGTLLIVGHGTLPPWAWEHHPHEDMPDAEHVWAALDLPPEDWELVRLELADRPVTGPEGQQATMADSIVQARRLR